MGWEKSHFSCHGGRKRGWNLFREEEGTVVISTIYAIALLFALLIFSFYTFFYKTCEKPFILLFGSISLVNLGYLLISLSKTVSFALFANTLAYFGSTFLPMLMLLILLESLGKKASRKTVIGLSFLALAIFLLTATQLIPEIDLYYQDVTLIFTEDGAAFLDKEYGPCHILYTVYLLGYFGIMIFFALSAVFQKKLESEKQTVALLVAVFVNLCVWFAEQFTLFKLEFLAISYLISEVFLLIFRMLILENQKLKESLAEKEKQISRDCLNNEALIFLENIKLLTPTEKVVLDHYISGKSTIQTIEAMQISQNTLKYHNKNLYSKLFVSSRKELLEKYHEAIKHQ